MDEVRELAGTPVLVLDGTGPRIATVQDALDLIGHGKDWVAIPATRLDPEFFRLSSGVAGEILQKFINYRCGLAVIGDISAHTTASEPLAALVRESNRGRNHWFLPTLGELAARLSA